MNPRPDRDRTNPDHRDPADAVVDALLVEAHTVEERAADAPARRAAAAALAARFADGDGAAAAGRAAEAARYADAPIWSFDFARRRPWLVAAAATLAVALVLQPWGRPAAPDPGLPGANGQDPVGPRPNDPDGVYPVRGLDELRALLPRVERVELEVLRLPDADIPFDVELAGVPMTVAPALRDRLLAGLATAAAVGLPAGWDWPNDLTFVLDDGRRLALAIYPYDRGAQQTIGLRGLRGDLALRGDAVTAVREMLDAATHVARIAHGVVLGPADLEGDAAFPASLEALRLFGVGDGDLAALQRFPDLRQLDCRGLNQTLGAAGLRAIGRCAGLQQLDLRGCAVTDDDLRWLVDLLELRALDLSGTHGLTGEGFAAFTRSARWRRGPTDVGLAGVSTLTDAGLERIAQAMAQATPADPTAPRRLRLDLGGAHQGIGARGWRALLATPDLRALDLSGWPLDAARLRDLAARPDLEVLTLADCDLDDDDAALLAATKAPLRELSLRDNPALTDAGLDAVAGLRTLRRLDIRGIRLTDDEFAVLHFHHEDVEFVR